MAGFGMALAGGLAGIGDSLVSQAKAEREERLAAIRRQWDREDATLAHTRAVDRMNMQNQYDIDAENRRNDRTDQLARDAANAFANGDPGRAGEAMTYLMDKYDMPAHLAAGFVGNTMQESGPGLNSTAVGDNGNAYGVIQHNGPRKEALFAWAKQEGRDPSDIFTQLDFAIHELQTTESAAWEAAMKTTTAEEAAQVLSDKFWRPGTPHNENRKAYAAKLFEIMANPDNTPEVRETAKAKLAGMGEAAGTTKGTIGNYEWVDNGDGTETKVGYVNGQQVPVTGLDGSPITRKGNSTWTELKSHQINEIEEDLKDEFDNVDVSLTNAFSAEIERIMNEDKLSFVQAKSKAFETADREQITSREGGFLGFGGEEVTREGDYTGTFGGSRKETETTATAETAPTASDGAPEVGAPPRGLAPQRGQGEAAIPRFSSAEEVKAALKAGEIKYGDVVIVNGQKSTIKKGKSS